MRRGRWCGILQYSCISQSSVPASAVCPWKKSSIPMTGGLCTAVARNSGLPGTDPELPRGVESQIHISLGETQCCLRYMIDGNDMV